jgi:hypothetical protein
VESVQAKFFGGLFPLMQGRTTVFSWDVLYVAAGAITGLRACATMLISGTLCWGVFVPLLQSTGKNSEFSIASSFKKDETQSKFLTRLSSPTSASPVDQYLWSQFPEETRQALLNSALKPDEAKRLLVPALNEILRRPGFFEASRFAGIKLSEETKVLLESAPGSVPPARLNRMLLQDSFPGTFAPSTGFPGLVQWTLWGGTACMVTSGLLAFLLQWKSVMRALKSLGSIFSSRKATEDPLEAIETPMSWFAIGQGISLIALAILAHESFHMPYWQSVVAVGLSFLLALVACRITGETDTTPIGAMGKVTQLTFGALNPGNINVNLMSANITASAAGSSADLLTDLKSGYLLGANPRKQFLAQFAGIFIGTLVTVLAFRMLVPSLSAVGTKEFPAPAAQTWSAVAKALSQGISVLEPVKVQSMIIGGIVGVVLVLLPLGLPRWQKFFPSAAAFGLAWVFEWGTAFLFFLGALIAWMLEKKAPAASKEFTFPVASGLIAGGSLMGVVLIFTENGPAMWQSLKLALGW